MNQATFLTAGSLSFLPLNLGHHLRTSYAYFSAGVPPPLRGSTVATEARHLRMLGDRIAQAAAMRIAQDGCFA